MRESDTGYLIAALIAALWLVHSLYRWARAAAERAEARRRVRHGFSAEEDAAELLEAHGYRVVDRQAAALWPVECGDERSEIRLRADLVVEDEDGLVYVAEVKTGDAGPSVYNAGTRRQLLEYLLAYPVHGVLLVNIDADCVEEVRFPGITHLLEP